MTVYEMTAECKGNGKTFRVSCVSTTDLPSIPIAHDYLHRGPIVSYMIITDGEKMQLVLSNDIDSEFPAVQMVHHHDTLYITLDGKSHMIRVRYTTGARFIPYNPRKFWDPFECCVVRFGKVIDARYKLLHDTPEYVETITVESENGKLIYQNINSLVDDDDIPHSTGPVYL